MLIPEFYPISIVEMKNGSLMAETGFQSTDHRRTWTKSEVFKPVHSDPIGRVRLDNGELGSYYAEVNDGKTDIDAALGNASNRSYFRWSSSEAVEGVPTVKDVLLDRFYVFGGVVHGQAVKR